MLLTFLLTGSIPVLAYAQQDGTSRTMMVEVTLTSNAPDAAALLDDDEVPVQLPKTFRYPAGTLKFRVFAEGYRPLSAELALVVGEAATFHADLEKLSAAEREFLAGSKRYNAARTGLFWGGGGLLGVSFVLFLLPQADSPAQRNLYSRFAQARTRSEGDRLYAELTQNAERAQAIRTAAWILLGVGAAATLTGVLMWVFEPDPPAESVLRNLSVSPLGVSWSF